MVEQFVEKGFAGPISVLSKYQCRRLVSWHRKANVPLIPDWPKALATVSPSVFRIATMPVVLDPVREILGTDIILWGASFVKRIPGQHHHWHNDVETAVAEGKTVSVWIGIRNCTKNSSLQVISGSHKFKESIQEMRRQNGVRRDEVSVQNVLQWAKQKNPHSELALPELRNGEALFFDGWLWHASHNTGRVTRTALLLQFATPDARIRIPDPNNFEWPFKTLEHPKPPCILVSGGDHYGVNRIVSAPVVHDGKEQQVLSSRIYQMDIPLFPAGNNRWEAFPIFRGSTPNLQSMCCHASALLPGNTPHPPHQHREEEILILLKGSAQVTLPDLASEGLETVVQMLPGDFVYYPAWFFHTITATGDAPANYLMFKWFNLHDRIERQNRLRVKPWAVEDGRKAEREVQNNSSAHPDVKLQYGKYSVGDFIPSGVSGRRFAPTLLFQESTDCLHALQCHITVVQPGGGYIAHADAHDVAIITMKGTIECLGERFGPNSVLYFPAGQLHDMHNPTSEPAGYLVFEFHGNHPPPVRRKRRTFLQKMRDPNAWKNKFRELRRMI